MFVKYTSEELLEWAEKHYQWLKTRYVTPHAAVSIISYFLTNRPEVTPKLPKSVPNCVIKDKV